MLKRYHFEYRVAPEKVFPGISGPSEVQSPVRKHYFLIHLCNEVSRLSSDNFSEEIKSVVSEEHEFEDEICAS